MTRIIAEIGSCHMGKWDYCKEAIDLCADLRLDGLKFQLFPNIDQFTKSGNVWMPPDLFLRCMDYGSEQGVNVSASVFGDDEARFLLSANPKFAKISYSQKHRIDWIKGFLDADIETIVSCDVMTDRSVPTQAKKLFCIPQYPVYFEVCFDELFPRFDGFSDHTLGIDQTIYAVSQGAQIIEKHITLNHSDISCPDSFFAITPGDLMAFVSCIRGLDGRGELH